MSDYADYRVSLWNRYGEFNRYIQASFHFAESLNEVGWAEFSLAKDDPACRRHLLQFGNYVLFEHERLGDWGGVIAPHNGRDWSGNKVVTIRAQGGAFQFSRRRAPLRDVNGKLFILDTAGMLMRHVINFCNQRRDALLRPGYIVGSGRVYMLRLIDKMCRDQVEKLAHWTRSECWVTPDRDEHNRLVFKVNLSPRRGGNRGYTLREGINLQVETDSFYREDADEFVNDFAVISATDDGGYERGTAEDRDSINEYDLWQGSEDISEGDPEVYATSYVEDHAEPRHTYKVTVIESPEAPDAFAHIPLGDTVRLLAHSAGFYYNEIGVETDVRIVSREYSTEPNKVLLTVEDAE